MLLVLDVGNTNTVLGLYDEDAWQVDWRVRRAPCVVADTPFFDPPRKRA